MQRNSNLSYDELKANIEWEHEQQQMHIDAEREKAAGMKWTSNITEIEAIHTFKT